MRSIKVFSAAVLLAAASSAAQAAVVWDQPLATWINGWCSPCGGDLPAPNYDYRTWGSFSLTSNTTLTGGRFAVDDIGPASDNLHISIWDSPTGTELFSVLLTGGTYTKESIGSDDRYWAVVSLPNWMLAAGDYWVSLFGTNGNRLGWGTDSRLGDDAQYSGTGALVSAARYVGFQLQGEGIPEPGSLALVAIGLAGFGWSVRRKRATT